MLSMTPSSTMNVNQIGGIFQVSINLTSPSPVTKCLMSSATEFYQATKNKDIDQALLPVLLGVPPLIS